MRIASRPPRASARAGGTFDRLLRARARVRTSWRIASGRGAPPMLPAPRRALGPRLRACGFGAEAGLPPRAARGVTGHSVLWLKGHTED